MCPAWPAGEWVLVGASSLGFQSQVSNRWLGDVDRPQEISVGWEEGQWIMSVKLP